jgi:hypothetical protein
MVVRRRGRLFEYASRRDREALCAL